MADTDKKKRWLLTVKGIIILCFIIFVFFFGMYIQHSFVEPLLDTKKMEELEQKNELLNKENKLCIIEKNKLKDKLKEEYLD